MNDLQLYFETNEGRLIHKWTHYFEIYDRHFSKFRNRDICIVEIGVAHGGSLQMWKSYFGPQARIIGIDVDPRCQAFEEEGIEIIIGSQEDRDFLTSLKAQLPRIDILLDDGGHTMRQQITTFEELFPHVSETGLYLCEDLHTSYWQYYGGGFCNSNSYIEYSKRLVDSLNAWHTRDPESFRVTDFTRSAYAMHYYDSVLVIEKRLMSAPRDRIAGVPSFADDEITQRIEQLKLETQAPQQIEVHPFPESAQSFIVEQNSKYFELLDAHEQTQTHARNLEATLKEVQTAFELTHNHAQNLEAELQLRQQELEHAQQQILQQQAHVEQLQNQVLQQQDYIGQLQNQLISTQSKLSHSQIQSAQTSSRLEQAESDLQVSRQQLEEERARVGKLRSRLQNKRIQLEQSQERIAAMQSSKFWKIRKGWFKVKAIFGLPTDEELEGISTVVVQEPSEQRTNSEHLLPSVSVDRYDKWLRQNTPKPPDLKRFVEILEVFPYKPIISIIMPVYNPPERFLREAIESVLAQVYPHWELCIADDASTELYVQQVLEEYSAKDPRIKVVVRPENGHISRCSNSALELANGEFIALLDHDDLLSPDALYEVVLLLNRQPEVDMIYSDEDKIDEHNKRKDPFFKPDWCPDSFLSRMYTCHLGVYRRSIVNQIGGFRIGFEGSQDYDLVLRFTEMTDRISHIPKILYHWRMHSESFAENSDAKPYAFIASEKALSEALERRNEKGKIIGVPKCGGYYSVRYQIQSYKLVSIVIPTKDLGQILDRCLESIFTESTYPNYEVIVIDNGSIEPYTAQVISKWLTKEPNRFKCHALDIPFNYSKLNNYGVSQAKGEFLLFLNNDTEVVTSDWIDAMVEQAQRPSIGAVGALLLYPDNTVQHAGVVLGIGGVAGHSHKHFSSTAASYYSQVVTINNYSAVTAACLMCRRESFNLVGGFDETLAVAFNDVDFCLKLTQNGMRNIYLPHVVLYHYESKSRGRDDTPAKQARAMQEEMYMYERWKSLLECDPCYSPNLTLQAEDYSLKELSESEDNQHIDQIQQAQARAERLRFKLEATRESLEQVQNRVTAMETSKFWKMRKSWFRVKQLFGSSEEA